MNPSERGSTRPKTLLVVVTLVLLGSLAALLAQGLRITSVKETQPGQLAIEYQTDIASSFRLLRGSTVTNITAPVATNNTYANSGRFVQTLPNSSADAAFFRVEPLAPDPDTVPLTTFTSSPADGEGDVSVNRETILRFSNPLASDTMIGNDAFFANYGGRKLLSRIELSSDKKTATLFYLETVPASARIRVTFLGDSVFDFLGRPVDADVNGLPGGIAEIDFDTLSITPVGQTAIIGRVFASELVPDPNGTGATVNKPLVGVTISVDGAEETLRAVTDSIGNFKLQPCPAGRFFVHIDGRTSSLSKYPNGAYYPFVGKAWEAAAGRDDNLAGDESHAQRTGNIYLPLIPADALKPVSATEETVITFPRSILEKNPQFAGAELRVPPNALYSDNGARGGRVGIAPVPPDRLPGALPPSMEPTLVFTVQSDGPLNFDRPVPIRLPNLPNSKTGEKLSPGSKSALWSFNHDVGQWEMVGAMTVTDDGLFVETDPGIGILQPGWGYTAAGAAGSGGGGCPKPPCCLGGNSGGQPFSAYLTCVTLVGCTTTGAPVDGLFCGVQRQRCKDCSGYDPDNTKQLSVHSKLHDAISSEVAAAIAEIWQIDTKAEPIYRLLEGALADLEANPNDVVARERIRNLEVELDSLIGGSYQETINRLIAVIEQSPLEISFEKSPRSNPLFFVTRVNGTEIRGRTDSEGVFRLRTGPSSGPVVVTLYDPVRDELAFTTIKKIVNATNYEFPPYVEFKPWDRRDSDSDGLLDNVEFVVGTNPNAADSDGDGIPDGVEVRQGTNPLDGRPVATGVIATQPLSNALDVCAFDNRAIVAMGDPGVAVLNVFNGLNPTLVAQVDTPGSALQVACAGNLIGVADRSAGFAIIDVSNPSNAALVRQIPNGQLGFGETRCVAATADIFFEGQSTGFINMLDANTGIVFQRVELGGSVDSLAVEGVTLYALANGRLHVLPFANGVLSKRGSVEAQTGRLFVGNGLAHVGSGRGFRVFEVSNPDSPSLVTNIVTTQVAWRQMVPNGSGYGLGVVAVNPNSGGDVQLFDLRGRINTFVTLLDTPGNASAASIFNGLAYVADGNAGLQVINYVPYDAKKQPPTGTLVLSSPDELTSGQLVVVRAEVQDDVQVRNVEFFVDSQRIAIDGNFPFETVYRVPTNATGNKLKFSVNIFDTGGNTASVTNAPLNVVPDNQPPGISIDSPADQQVFFVGDDVPIKVTAIDNSGIESVTFQLNGASVPVRRLSFYEWQIALDELPTGTNMLIATATDLAGLKSTSNPVRFVLLKEAISREISTFNFGPKDTAEAVSREVSTFNFGPKDVTEAISREVSVENQKPAAAAASGAAIRLRAQSQ